MEENKNLELNEEELESEECNCEEQTIDESLIALEMEKELDRLERLCIFDDDTQEKMAETNEFTNGIKAGLYLSGMYSTLVSYGIPEDKAIELVINQQTIDHNILTTKLTNEASIQVSKNQSIQVDKATM